MPPSRLQPKLHVDSKLWNLPPIFIYVFFFLNHVRLIARAASAFFFFSPHFFSFLWKVCFHARLLGQWPCNHISVRAGPRVRRSKHVVRGRIKHEPDKFNPPQCLPENYPGHRSYKLACHLCNTLEQKKIKINNLNPFIFFFETSPGKASKCFLGSLIGSKVSAQVVMALCCGAAEPLCHFLCPSRTVFFTFVKHF